MSHITYIALAASIFVASAAQSPESSSNVKHQPSSACIDVETIVNAPLAEVWRVWTTSAGAQEFFAPKAEIELHPGGSYNILFMPDNKPGERGAEGQRVLSVLPMEMVSFEWGAPPKFPFARAHPGWVVVQFKSIDASRTHVRLVHLGFDHLKKTHPDHAAEFDQTRDYFSKAWPTVMSWLKRRFDEGPRWDASGNTLWKD